MRWVIISVSDKTGIVEFAKRLLDFEFNILASSGTKKLLAENKIKCKSIDSITGFPEILSGRVKTLHPKIFGGILADREKHEHIEELQKFDIPHIDLVVCNLYPFEKQPGIENIDIGGVSLIRAAAKNYKYVTCVTNPAQYSIVLQELEKYGKIRYETQTQFAKTAFKLTSMFDSRIVEFLGDGMLNLTYEKAMDLRYGENPHQSAQMFVGGTSQSRLPTISIACAKKLQGKELSYNNIQDLDAALLIIKSFDSPMACVLKHLNPCGLALDEDMVSAYKKARAGDPVSSFGGIVGVNRHVTEELAQEITSTFIEAVIAPGYTDSARKVLGRKKNLRVLELPLDKELSAKTYKWIEGGILVQDSDILPDNYAEWEVVTKKKPLPQQYSAAKFAFKILRFLKSNSICITSSNQTLGIGVGQPNRVGALKIAINNMREFGFSPGNVALASDGFFPFRDSIDVAYSSGIKCIVQPGGSIRDKEVIDACNEHNITMLFTHRRHFLH